MKKISTIVLLLGALGFSSDLLAQKPSGDKKDRVQTATPADASVQVASSQENELLKNSILGPSKIMLDQQAVLDLPKGYRYLPKAQANQLMTMLGNQPTSETMGMIISDKNSDSWFALIEYKPQGYIKDDDAKDWDADGMLTSLKEGTEEDNKRRKSQGIPEIQVIGWAEKPNYNASKHHLVWSIDLIDKIPTCKRSIDITSSKKNII